MEIRLSACAIQLQSGRKVNPNNARAPELGVFGKMEQIRISTVSATAAFI
jgi:hypothetical protein